MERSQANQLAAEAEQKGFVNGIPNDRDNDDDHDDDDVVGKMTMRDPQISDLT